MRLLQILFNKPLKLNFHSEMLEGSEREEESKSGGVIGSQGVLGFEQYFPITTTRLEEEMMEVQLDRELPFDYKRCGDANSFFSLRDEIYTHSDSYYLSSPLADLGPNFPNLSPYTRFPLDQPLLTPQNPKLHYIPDSADQRLLPPSPPYDKENIPHESTHDSVVKQLPKPTFPLVPLAPNLIPFYPRIRLGDHRTRDGFDLNVERIEEEEGIVYIYTRIRSRNFMDMEKVYLFKVHQTDAHIKSPLYKPLTYPIEGGCKAPLFEIFPHENRMKAMCLLCGEELDVFADFAMTCSIYCMHSRRCWPKALKAINSERFHKFYMCTDHPPGTMCVKSAQSKSRCNGQNQPKIGDSDQKVINKFVKILFALLNGPENQRFIRLISSGEIREPEGEEELREMIHEEAVNVKGKNVPFKRKR